MRWKSPVYALASTIILALSCAHSQEFPRREYDLQVSRYLDTISNLTFDLHWVDTTERGIVIHEESRVATIAGHFRVRTVRRSKTPKNDEFKKVEWFVLRP